MSFATNIAAGGKSPVYITEFAGDAVDAAEFDSVANWAESTDVSSLAVDTGDAKDGTGSIGFDKTGTTQNGALIQNSSLTAFDIATIPYLTLAVRQPTTTAGTEDYLLVRIGDSFVDAYSWSIPAALFTAGKWTTLYLSLNELSSEYTSFSTVGTPTPGAVNYIVANWVGTSTAYTFTGARVDFLAKHPYRYSTGPITSPVADTKQGWMLTPSITGNRYDPTRGTLSSSSASCKVIDSGGATVITDFGNFAMLQRQATVYMGFRGTAETSDNFEAIHRGPVDKTPHSGKAWTFQLGDMLRAFKVPFAQDAAASDYTITGNIVTVFLKLALSTGNGTNLGSFAANYDTETAVRGAGISADLFSTDIETTRDDWMSQDSCSFTFTETEDSLLDWFLKQVCFAYGVFPVIKGDGKISIRAVEEGVYPSTGTPTVFGVSNLIAAKIPPFTQDSQRVKNQVRLIYGWSSATEKFATDSANTYQLATSVTRYGVQALKIESKGILTADTSVAKRVSDRYLRLLGEGAPPIELSTMMSQQPREAGELVDLTIPRTVPDLDAKTYGITGKLAEIEWRSFDPAKAGCSFRVGLTSYQSGNYKLVSAIAGDYDSATAAQQAKYAWVSDGSDQLGAGNVAGDVVGPG